MVVKGSFSYPKCTLVISQNPSHHVVWIAGCCFVSRAPGVQRFRTLLRTGVNLATNLKMLGHSLTLILIGKSLLSAISSQVYVFVPLF